MLFKDHVTIHIKGGKGGDGSFTFRRAKFVPRGGPDGGDGGRGGDIVVRADKGMRTLSHFRENQRFGAGGGGNGARQNKQGKRGKDVVLTVPCGTVVYSISDGAQRSMIIDLEQHNEQTIIAKGGKGGLGNNHFATPIHQAPKTADRGLPGEQYHIALELKILADVGLVGLPNAGKSTLLSVLSRAKPKIASYPFTTLSPNLGLVELEKWLDLPITGKKPELVVADIPGLIEGAHLGKGLGDRFLKHIERTSILLHLLDASLPIEDIESNFKTIEHELMSYDTQLSKKEHILVFTKIDLVDTKTLKIVQKQIKKKFSTYETYYISALDHQNIQELIQGMWNAYTQKQNEKKQGEKKVLLQPLVKEDEGIFTITKQEQGWFIQGKKVEDIVLQTYMDNEDSVKRMFIRLRKMGLVSALEKEGIEDGDEVHVAGKVLIWE